MYLLCKAISDTNKQMPKATTTSSKANADKAETKTTKNEKAEKNAKAEKKQGSVKVTAEDAKKLKNPVKGAKDEAKDAKTKDSAKGKGKGAAKKGGKGKKSGSASSTGKAKRMAGVEKGEAPNAGTAYINGTFNVNLARKELKKYISNTLGLELGTINAQYPYTAIAESLALYVVRASGKFNTKSAKKADLYEVTLENMRRAIRESNEFGADIKSLSESFNPTAMNYTTSFFDTEKVLRTFLETKAFTNTTNVHINSESLNFVCYLLSHTLANLTKTSCYLSQYAKKKNVQIKNFRFACNIHFSGELNELLTQRLSEIEALFANNKEGEEGVEEDEKSTGSKGGKGKKDAKASTSKKAAKDKDEEEDAEDEEDEDEVEEDEADEEEEEEEDVDEDEEDEEDDE